MKRGSVTNRITFDEVFALVACPYCKAPKGTPCSGRYQGKPSSDPHGSRARAAFSERKRSRSREMKRNPLNASGLDS